jgi:hypothetical protein
MSEAAIRETIRLYIEGMTLGDEAKLRRAFHPRAQLLGHFDGGLEWDTLDGQIAVFRENAAPEGTEPVWQVDAIRITGDTGVAHVTDEWCGMRFRDTLALLHHEGRWVIVTKLFFHESGDA